MGLGISCWKYSHRSADSSVCYMLKTWIVRLLSKVDALLSTVYEGSRSSISSHHWPLCITLVIIILVCMKYCHIMGLFVSFLFVLVCHVHWGLWSLFIVWLVIQNISIKGIFIPLCMLKKYLEGEYVRVYESRIWAFKKKRTLVIIVVIGVFKQGNAMNKERLKMEMCHVMAGN